MQQSSYSNESIGRYVLHPAFARGGMASVHTAQLLGAEGFTRLVAAKRLHPQFADDPEFVEMFLDEARIASKIHHPNVVPVLDVVLAGPEVILVQEYVHGVPLSQLFKTALADSAPIPVPIVVAVVTGVLAGLHAAHEAKDERGESLDIVHRDVSPQNVIVSVDGIPRLLDFGIAKARTSAHVTLEGFFKGKIAYMPPEQLRMERVTRKADIYAAGVLMWELLAHRRLHSRQQRETEFVAAVVNGGIPALSVALEDTRPRISAERWQSIVALERVVGRALALDADDRWSTAHEMAEAILAAQPAATGAEVAHLVKGLGAEYLAQREASIAANEESVRSTSLRAAPPVSGAVRREAVTLEAPPSIAPPPPPASSSPIVVAPAPRPDVRALAPWLVTGGALVVIGVLIGVLSAREQQTISEPVTAGSVTMVTSEPPATASQTATATATATPTASASASATTTAKPPIVFTSAPRIFVAPPPPRPTHTAAAPSAPATPASSASKTDCNPPFYFDGSKKVFKSNCI